MHRRLALLLIILPISLIGSIPPFFSQFSQAVKEGEVTGVLSGQEGIVSQLLHDCAMRATYVDAEVNKRLLSQRFTDEYFKFLSFYDHMTVEAVDNAHRADIYKVRRHLKEYNRSIIDAYADASPDEITLYDHLFDINRVMIDLFDPLHFSTGNAAQEFTEKLARYDVKSWGIVVGLLVSTSCLIYRQTGGADA